MNSKISTKKKRQKQKQKKACQEVPFPHKILKMGYTSVPDPYNVELKEKNHALL